MKILISKFRLLINPLSPRSLLRTAHVDGKSNGKAREREREREGGEININSGVDFSFSRTVRGGGVMMCWTVFVFVLSDASVK